MTAPASPLSFKPAPASKVLVIGLDGASWTILDPLIASGHLPNLSKLISGGTRGILTSTIPPVTACAWPSFYTGRTPANHGVFDFRKRMGKESTKRQWVSQSDIGGPTIWDIVSAQGKTVGLINLPLTFPPVEVNGYMIGGMPVPSATDDIGFPKGLVGEIMRETGGYTSDIDLLRGESPDVKDPAKCMEFVDEVRKAVEVRGRAAEYLMDKYPKDFTFLVLVTPDRLSHLFYKILNPRGKDLPLSDSEKVLKNGMIDALDKMDAVVGNVVGRMGDDDLIAIMSDHGFGPLDGLVKMNRILSELGFLKFKPEAEGGLKRKIGRLLPESIKKPLRSALGLDGKHSQVNERKKPHFDPYALIDWENTRAYSGGSTEQGIFLNVVGREPYGVVQMGAEYHKTRDELISLLADYRKPDRSRLFDWVRPGEEIHSGIYTADAPDIIFEIGGYTMVVGEDAEPPTIGPWSQHRAGYHRREGVLVLHGPMIKNRFDLGSTEIINIAPTILNCWNLAMEEQMDGSVVTETLKDEFSRMYPPVKAVFERSAGKIETCARDDSEVEDLMKGLGYLN